MNRFLDVHIMIKLGEKVKHREECSINGMMGFANMKFCAYLGLFYLIGNDDTKF
jgi:hypothetical protein